MQVLQSVLAAGIPLNRVKLLQNLITGDGTYMYVASRDGEDRIVAYSLNHASLSFKQQQNVTCYCE